MRIDHDDRQSGARQSGGDEGLEASGGLQTDRSRPQRAQPLDQRGQTLRVARNDKTFVPPANMYIQLTFRNVYADNGGVHPARPAQAGYAGGPSDCSGSMERRTKTLAHPRA